MNMSEESGGYLVPHYIDKPKSGIVALLWRKLGRLFNNDNWYNRGIQTIDFYASLFKDSKEPLIGKTIKIKGKFGGKLGHIDNCEIQDE